jgi:hypothetical protein
MNKTIFDIDDIHALRCEREAEYAALGDAAFRELCSSRANEEWAAIIKMRGLINDWYKCPNILTPQSDKLPAPKIEPPPIPS